jgi:hypothetical protein
LRLSARASATRSRSDAPAGQHDLARARGPGAIAFDVLQAFQKTANIDQQTGELGANGIKRVTHALPGSDDRLGQRIGPISPTATASGGQWI